MLVLCPFIYAFNYTYPYSTHIYRYLMHMEPWFQMCDEPLWVDLVPWFRIAHMHAYGRKWEKAKRGRLAPIITHVHRGRERKRGREREREGERERVGGVREGEKAIHIHVYVYIYVCVYICICTNGGMYTYVYI